MPKECDKCGAQIIKGQCVCGVWLEKEAPKPPLVEAFTKIFEILKETPIEEAFSGDHHSGWAFVFFKGTYEDTQKVRLFIKEEKKQSH